MKMTLSELPIGTRVYNHGDMANCSHFGTITGYRHGQVEITPDEGGRNIAYCVPAVMFSSVFAGHSGTRFVTEAAYKAYRAEQIARLGYSVK